MSAVLYASGGSGGHLAPAIALAQRSTETKKRQHTVWVSTTTKQVDRRLQEAYGELHFKSFRSAPLTGRIGALIRAVFVNTLAVFEATGFLVRIRADAVLATGGFGCAPVLAASCLLGVSAFLHESNSVPGKVSRWFRPVLKRFFRTRLLREEYVVGKNGKVVGFPLRRDFKVIEKKLAKKNLGLDADVPLVTIFGGSQGAKALTVAAESHAESWEAKGYQVICVSGPGNYQPDVSKIGGFKLLPFVDDMGCLLSATDVLVARSGAGSIAEIANAQCPSILVPLPGSADNHQFYNAKAFRDAGCSVMLEQDRLVELEEKVDNLLRNEQLRENLIDRMRAWSEDNSISEIIREVEGARMEVAV